MKKVFLLIFCVLQFYCFSVNADVFKITDIDQNRLQNKSIKPSETLAKDTMPDPRDQQAVREFFKKRLEQVAVTPAPEGEDYNNPTSINVVHTPDYYRKLEEEKKPLFQKMYEEAVRMVNEKDEQTKGLNPSANQQELEDEAAETATRFFTLKTPQKPRIEEDYNEEPQIATVGFSLPSGRRMLAPAIEHIPYFLSYIDIQANGYLKIEDTVIVVADGQKFATAMERVFPKYVYDNNGRKQRIELTLTDVSINETPVKYIVEESGNDIILKPKYKQQLESGVYTYTFNYLVNYQLQKSGKNVTLNWNLTGRPLNAFITSANAIVTLPNGFSFKNAQGIIGQNGQYTNRRTNIIPMSANVVAFSNWTPVKNGETMNIITVADATAFLPDFDRGFSHFLSNWSGVFYSGLGFVAILLSFVLSLLTLKKEQKSRKYNPSYNGSLMRQIMVGKYDRTAFVAQLLELYRKQAIDLSEENNRLFIMKKNSETSRLNAAEKKALKILFSKKMSQVEVNVTHNQTFKKIKNIFINDNNKQIKKHRFMHNIIYLIFSSAMLLCSEVFIALAGTNTAQMLVILLTLTAIYAFYIWLLSRKFKHRWIALIIKAISLIALFFVWVFGSVYIGGITNLIILLTLVVIFAFTGIFSKKNSYIDEAKSVIDNYKEYLLRNADAINLSREFLNQQSNIFALDIADYFPHNSVNKSFYKLDIAEHLRKNLVGIF